MSQITLFEYTPPGEVEKILRLITSASMPTRALGLHLSRQHHLSLLALLKIAIRQKWARDWEGVWNEFELTGRMQFCRFDFGFMEVNIYEDEAGQLCFNNYLMYCSGADDEFTSELTEKYISFCEAHIQCNAAYFINNINGTWKN